jgi:hypothetical protein
MSFFAQTTGPTTTLITTQLTQDEPGAFSTGGIVFFVVLAFLAVGATSLYLSNRSKGTGAGS